MHSAQHAAAHLADRAPRPSPPLSPRERLILRSLDEDLTLAQIAAELFVSRNTVKTQVQSVYRKLGVSRRADAVAAAHALRLT
jgi:LuxR family transcriptional regulator, transcriptional regulator of spore coat protein